MRRTQSRMGNSSGDHEKRSRGWYGILNRQSRRAVMPIDSWRPLPEVSLEATLSSALSAQAELSGILRQVDEISKEVTPGTSKALGDALRRAVSCVVKQTAVDRELRSLAITDDLTGLHNRRGFLALATQQLKVTRRKGQELLLYFADVDSLKEINDSFGHSEGDLALLHTAKALEQTFRGSDILARIGGDEFAVLALEASRHSQQSILRRFEQNLASVNAGECRYILSVSIGVARLSRKHAVSLAELMAQADHAMYAEKEKYPILAEATPRRRTHR